MNHQIIIVFIVQFIIRVITSLIGNIQLYLDRKKLGYIFPVMPGDDFYSKNKNYFQIFTSINKEMKIKLI